jgi:hypothetical protein
MAKKPGYDRRIIAVRGDMHAGMDDGLKNPATLIPMVDLETGDRELDKLTPVSLRPFQKKLWGWHEEAREGIAQLAGEDPITFLDMGDTTEGNWRLDNKGEVQMSDQYFIAKASFFPWLDMKQVEEVYIVRGTAAHTFGAGSSETVLTDALHVIYPNKTIKTAHHWLMNIAGLWLDIAHKGPFYGKRYWLKANEFHWYIQNVLMEDVADGDQPPDVMLRAHFHTYTRGWGWCQNVKGYWECHGIITPAMSFINEYAKGSTHSKSKISCGVIALEVISGRLHKVHDEWVHWIDLRTLEIVK